MLAVELEEGVNSFRSPKLPTPDNFVGLLSVTKAGLVGCSGRLSKFQVSRPLADLISVAVVGLARFFRLQSSTSSTSPLALDTDADDDFGPFDVELTLLSALSESESNPAQARFSFSCCFSCAVILSFRCWSAKAVLCAMVKFD